MLTFRSPPQRATLPRACLHQPRRRGLADRRCHPAPTPPIPLTLPARAGFGDELPWMTLDEGLAAAKADNKIAMVVIHKSWYFLSTHSTAGLQCISDVMLPMEQVRRLQAPRAVLRFRPEDQGPR